jgi:2-polyprenyl-3-methyl-5-hydroxy-6-metoxy-1,4-benzoquinol methylase
MARDALRKLGVDRTLTVLEIGCGVGVVGLPLARSARRYVGIDIAETALSVFRSRLSGAGLDARATLQSLDFVAATSTTVASLGQFDRVIAYAVLHYVANEKEGRMFMERALAALRPGGRVLLGNLPLAELQKEPESATGPSRGRVGRVAVAFVGALRPGRANAVGVVLTRRARLTTLLLTHSLLLLRPVIPGARAAPRSLPSGTTLDLSRNMIEKWLVHARIDVHWEWLAPGLATPLATGRADLLIMRDA